MCSSLSEVLYDYTCVKVITISKLNAHVVSFILGKKIGLHQVILIGKRKDELGVEAGRHATR